MIGDFHHRPLVSCVSVHSFKSLFARIMSPKETSRSIQKRRVSLDSWNWARTGRTLGSGCSPTVLTGSPCLEKWRECSVCCSLSPSVTPQALCPHTLLFRLLSTIVAQFLPHMRRTPQRGNMSSISPHIVLKRSHRSLETSTLPLLIDLWSLCIHLSSYLFVFLSLCLAIYLSRPLTEEISIAPVSNQ